MKLCKIRRLSYSHFHGLEDKFINVMQHVLTQYTLKARMCRYKEWGNKGVTDEMKQIHNKISFKPVKDISLTTDQRVDALLALIFLK